MEPPYGGLFIFRIWTQQKNPFTTTRPRQTIGSLEKGRYNPSIQLAFKIARYFHMSIEDIFITRRNRNEKENGYLDFMHWTYTAGGWIISYQDRQRSSRNITGTAVSFLSDLDVACSDTGWGILSVRGR